MTEIPHEIKQENQSGKPTVLLVEDEADIAHILTFALEHEGCAVVRADDGLKAVEMIRTMPPPRLILLDVMLPRMDGMLLIPYIRSRPDWSEVPIVMLTAKAGTEDVYRAIDSGANSYITKPFQPLELMARLRTFLGTRAG